MKLREYLINYGWSHARMITPVPREEAIDRFYKLAGQCFGIRKSITNDPFIMKESDGELPDYVPNAHEMLVTNIAVTDEMRRLQPFFHLAIPDTIIWNAEGEKIKDEWDD